MYFDMETMRLRKNSNASDTSEHDYINKDDPDYVNQKYAEKKSDDYNGFMRVKYKPETHGYLRLQEALEDVIKSSEENQGGDSYKDDYTLASEFKAYEEPVPEVKPNIRGRALPPLPQPGVPGGFGNPPRPPPGRRRDVPTPPIQILNNMDPIPPPVPTSKRPNAPRGRPQPSPSPVKNHQSLSRTPSGDNPPPLPPGRPRPALPVPDVPQFIPPTPGRPHEGLPKRLPPQPPQPPQPPDHMDEEVYEQPDDDGETYEELPPDDLPTPPPPRGRALPVPPAANRAQPPPMPRSMPPYPAPVPEKDAPIRIGPDALKKLRKTPGPQNKPTPPSLNKALDSDKKPGFNTIREAFQERAPIMPKRGSVESNPSSEESSGSGEFQGPVVPRLPAASNSELPLPPYPTPPRQPNIPSARSPSPVPYPPTDALTSFDWYFGDISRQDADAKVQFSKDGTFLVRASRKGGDTNPYTLVVWCENKVWNVRLRLRKDEKFAVGSARDNEQTFSTIPELINFHKNTPILLTNEKGGVRLGQTTLKNSPRK